MDLLTLTITLTCLRVVATVTSHLAVYRVLLGKEGFTGYNIINGKTRRGFTVIQCVGYSTKTEYSGQRDHCATLVITSNSNTIRDESDQSQKNLKSLD